MSKKFYWSVFLGVLIVAAFFLVSGQKSGVKAGCSGQIQCYWNDLTYGCQWDYLTDQAGCGGQSPQSACENYGICDSNPCQNGGCYWTGSGSPTPTSPPGAPTPTSSPGCSCGSWNTGSCGGGSCALTELQETRSCSPPGCSSESRCIPDASCSVPSCSCSAWVDGACGGGGTCPADQRLQTRTCNPAGCGSETRCVSDSLCQPSCTLGLSDITLDSNQTVTFSPTVLQANGTVDTVTFTVSDTSVATVCDSATTPCPSGSGSYTDTPGFSANLTGKNPSPPTTTITVTGEMTDEVGGPIYCTPGSATVTVSNPGAWWQVIGGDVNSGKTGTGNISSAIPGTCTLPSCDPVLVRNNLEGYPGVPSTGGSITPSTVSSTNWKAEGSSYSASEIHDYAFFEKKARNVIFTNLGSSDITNLSQLTSGALTNGYYWVKYDGGSFAGAALKISNPIDLGSNKVVLFVKNAHLEINSTVNLTKGTGSFSVIANKDIVVSGNVGGPADGVPELEGIFLADGQFKTGSLGADSDSQLHVRGSVSGLGISGGVPGTNDGIDFERKLTDNSVTPGELFEFAPDQMFLFPYLISPRNFTWKEVSP